uniref:Secreted protein n=1 Tax=Rosa rugosa TaxID=74645 RepID=J7G2Y9_ROSRU|nr:hypothetical protein [Rosa rugosa]
MAYLFLAFTPFLLSVPLSSSGWSLEAFGDTCFEFGSEATLLDFLSTPHSYSSLRKRDEPKQLQKRAECMKTRMPSSPRKLKPQTIHKKFKEKQKHF